jgi:hypothetical protein
MGMIQRIPFNFAIAGEGEAGGTVILPGSPTVFESAGVWYCDIAALASGKAITVYKDAGNSNYGTACILDVSGRVITPGTPAVFESADVSYTSVAMLTAAKALAAYYDFGNSGYGTGNVLDVSGSTITPATPAVYESASSTNDAVAMLTSTKAIVAYTDGGNSSYGTAIVLDISGSTITPDTADVFESASTGNIAIAALSSTKAIVCYSDGGNSNYGTACILDISGSTITSDTPAVFESAGSTWISVAMLTSTKAIVTYRDGGNSGYGTACILNVSGSTITPATPAVFESADTNYTGVAMLLSTRAIVIYQDTGNESCGTACILTISGSTITPVLPTIFEYKTSSYMDVVALTSAKAIATYRDDDNSGYGTACVLDTAESGDGNSLVPGAVATHETGYAVDHSIAMLSATRGIVVYRDAGNSNYGTACLLDVSGTTITPRTPTVYESAATTYNAVVALSSTKALVYYQDQGNSSYGTACVLDISGTTITPGTPQTVSTSTSHSYCTLVALSATQAICTYQDGASSYGRARVLGVSGTTITANAEATFNSASSTEMSLCKLASNQALLVYRDAGGAGNGETCVLDVSGTTITPGSVATFFSSSEGTNAVIELSSSKAIVVFADFSGSSHGHYAILNISSSVVTPVTAVEFHNSGAFNTGPNGIAALSSSQAVVVYRDEGDAADGAMRILNISGDTVTLAVKAYFKMSYISDPVVTALSSSKVLVAFQDPNDTNDGKACVADAV